MKLDMSLNNYALYYGCIIAELGTAPYQRKVITTPMVDAIHLIVPNLRKILSSSFFKNSDSITIFGSTPAAPSNDATKASQESRILWSAWDGRCTIATTFGSFSKVARGELLLTSRAPMLA